MFVLAGDVGGTNTRLLCVEVKAGNEKFIAEHRYPSADFSDLAAVIERFVSDYQINNNFSAACIAVAGPVKSGVVSVTNLPWVIDEQELSRQCNIQKVKLVNDFIAVVHGIERIDDSNILIVHQAGTNENKSGHPDAAVIGVGTGCGIAQRRWIQGDYHALPSEAGHTGFAPQNSLQTGLLSWLQQKHSHVSIEMLLSGRGLGTIYQFLHEKGDTPSSATVDEKIKVTDPAKVITEYAIEGKDALCVATLKCFVEIYGAAAGNAALQFYPVGEVYIAGGIAPKIKKLLLEDDFIHAFTNKGPMSDNMKNMTIKLITEEYVGLYGALALAIKLSAATGS